MISVFFKKIDIVPGGHDINAKALKLENYFIIIYINIMISYNRAFNTFIFFVIDCSPADSKRGEKYKRGYTYKTKKEV